MACRPRDFGSAGGCFRLFFSRERRLHVKERGEERRLRFDPLEDLDKRWIVYDNLEKENTGKWLSNLEYIEWEKTHSTFKEGSKNYEAEINGLQKFYDEHRMFLLSEDRWEKHARPLCDNLFRAIAAGIDGKIVGIAEDGNQTWDMVDGALLPTDPKLQKKYQKKGLSYDNPEQ